MEKEFITHEPQSEDAWTCICKNTPSDDGFYPCNFQGEEVEPTAERWASGCGLQVAMFATSADASSNMTRWKLLGAASNMKRLNFFLSDKQIVALTSIAEQTGISLSEVIRRAIDQFIKIHDTI